MYVPAGYVEEDIRDDYAGQVARLELAVAHIPEADQRWEVRS